MSRVVVTGVAGAIGGRLAERLLARADVEQVVGIDLVAPSLADPKLDMRVMDLAAPADEHALDAALDGADALIHLAWLTADGPGRAADAASVAAANHRALAGVLGAAAKSGLATVVHLSSATVYGAWPDNKIPLTEDARLRPNPEFSFAVSKAEAERQVAEWADGHPSVRVSVLRPTVVVGTDERPLYRALGITRTPRSGDGVRPVQYLHVDDLVAAVVLAWERRLSGVYNVAPDSGITEDEARALAGGVARLALPDRLADAVSSFGWRLWRTGIPAEARAYATSPWVVAPDRIKEEGWQPEYSSEEALVATDERMHWDDLPPGRRQNYNLLVALIALAGVGAGVLAVLDFVRRRRRRA